MKDLFWEYLVSLYKDIPLVVYEVMLSFFCLGTVMLVIVLGIKKGLRFSMMLFLIEYICLLYSSTVIYRFARLERQGDLKPFWSYRAYLSGEVPQLLAENVMNVVVFVPVGLLLGLAFDKIKWWQVMIIGCGVSVSIEMLQLMLKRGFCEVDDVMHNTIGCISGYILVKGSWFMVNGLRGKKITA